MSKENKTNVRKTILRNTEIPVDNQKINVNACSKSVSESSNSKVIQKPNKHPISIQEKPSSHRYSQPALNSCRSISNKLEELKSSRVKRLDSFSELSPRTKEVAQDEVRERTIYRQWQVKL